MGKIAFVFPGQGAQAVGMGKDAYERPAGAAYFSSERTRRWGLSCSELIFEGPEEKLRLTYTRSRRS